MIKTEIVDGKGTTSVEGDLVTVSTELAVVVHDVLNELLKNEPYSFKKYWVKVFTRAIRKGFASSYGTTTLPPTYEAENK